MRGLAVLMSFLLAILPLAPIAQGDGDCCKSKPNTSGCPGEKMTRVNYTLTATAGVGTATIIGRYAPPGPLANTTAFQKTIALDPDKGVCVRGDFCAKDGEDILLKISISGEPKTSGLGAAFGATWGCSGHKELGTSDGDEGSIVGHGRMKTGVGASGGTRPAGSGSGSNGSVHFEWEMGVKLPESIGSQSYQDDPLLPKMLLNLETLAGVACTPELLRIPAENYLRIARVNVGGRQMKVTFQSTHANAAAAYALELSRWREEMNRTDFQLTHAIPPLQPRGFAAAVQSPRDDPAGYPIHPGDARFNLESRETVRDGMTGPIKQIRIETGLLVFDPPVDGAFKIKFYGAGQFSNNSEPGAEYPLTDPFNPLRSWRVANPNPEKWKASDMTFSIGPAPDNVETPVIAGYERSGLAGTRKIVKTSVRNAALTYDVASQNLSEFDQHHRLVLSSEGIAGENLDTEYHYPDDPAGEPEWMKRSDGYFEKYTYAGDRDLFPYTTQVIRP